MAKEPPKILTRSFPRSFHPLPSSQKMLVECLETAEVLSVFGIVCFSNQPCHLLGNQGNSHRRLGGPGDFTTARGVPLPLLPLPLGQLLKAKLFLSYLGSSRGSRGGDGEGLKAQRGLEGLGEALFLGPCTF